MDRKEQRKIFAQLKKKKEEELKLKTIEKYPDIHRMYLDGDVSLKDAYNHCMSELLNVEGYKSKGTKGYVDSTKIDSVKKKVNNPPYSLPYSKHPMIDDMSMNLTFHEINQMDYDEFKTYSEKLKKELYDIWNKRGNPPYSGKIKEDIVSDFKELKSFDVSKLKVETDSPHYKYVISSDYRIGNSCNQFMPSLQKTKVNNISLWNVLKDKEHKYLWKRKMVRNLKQDYLYEFSRRIKDKSDVYTLDEKYGLIIHKSETKSDISFSRKELEDFHQRGLVKDYHIRNLDDDFYSSEWFEIRKYVKSTRIFKHLTHICRVSFGNTPVNFSPVISRFLYEEFLDENQTSIVLDTSTGWGGRLLGSLCSERRIKYYGVDVNSNLFEPINCYDTIGEFVRNEIGSQNEFKIENISSVKLDKTSFYSKIKGKVDLFLTSPPYFDKENYSDDKEQSFREFPDYHDWISTYLKTTFQFVYDSLKPNGTCLVNISDIVNKGKRFNLEIDTIQILESIGFNYEYQLGMKQTIFMGISRDSLIKRLYDEKLDDYIKIEPVLVFTKN